MFNVVKDKGNFIVQKAKDYLGKEVSRTEDYLRSDQMPKDAMRNVMAMSMSGAPKIKQNTGDLVKQKSALFGMIDDAFARKDYARMNGLMQKMDVIKRLIQESL